ncbi:MAG TPA: GNAT family N-acetyltransferase [Gaiellaceae bacterium]
MIAFRRMVEDDLVLFHAWLQRPHVKRWWRDREVYDEVRAYYLPSIEGSAPTDHYLILLDGTPVGVIQTYLAADYPEWEAIVGMEPGLAGVDLLIGEGALTGQGLGPRALSRFTADVVFARPGTVACIATVEEENVRSWRAFEKAGFAHVRDVEEEGRPHRLMRLDRPG